MRLHIGYYAREIAGMAIACNACSLIISHNRLNYPKPSIADKTLIAQTYKMCNRLALKILDYLIITPNDCLSYKVWLNAN